MASVIAVNEAGELAMNAGLASAVEEAYAVKGKSAIFAVLNRSRDTYETGSEVTANSVRGILGVSRGVDTQDGRFTYGTFLEAGHSNFETENEFSGEKFYSDGHANYFGIGVLGKYELNNGFYYEGSLRAGRVKHDYSGVINLILSQYDSEAIYYGGHIGTGYVFDLKMMPSWMSMAN